ERGRVRDRRKTAVDRVDAREHERRRRRALEERGVPRLELRRLRGVVLEDWTVADREAVRVQQSLRPAEQVDRARSDLLRERRDRRGRLLRREIAVERVEIAALAGTRD